MNSSSASVKAPTPYIGSEPSKRDPSASCWVGNASASHTFNQDSVCLALCWVLQPVNDLAVKCTGIVSEPVDREGPLYACILHTHICVIDCCIPSPQNSAWITGDVHEILVEWKVTAMTNFCWLTFCVHGSLRCGKIGTEPNHSKRGNLWEKMYTA